VYDPVLLSLNNACIGVGSGVTAANGLLLVPDATLSEVECWGGPYEAEIGWDTNPDNPTSATPTIPPTRFWDGTKASRSEDARLHHGPNS
jgi:hypothetical protein